MMAGHHHLTNLTAILDYNRAQVDGRVWEIVDPEPVVEKWKAFNWDVCWIDGHNIEQILEAINWVKSLSRPGLILASTIKGKGVSFMEADPITWHGNAPSPKQVEMALAELRAEVLP